MPLNDNPLEQYRGALDGLPLKFGISSYVWPAGYVENVKRLKGVFGEIQLLANEPVGRSPVGMEEIDQLKEYGDGGVTYSLHLPTTCGMAYPGGTAEEDVIQTIMAFKPLDIANSVLHIENGAPGSDPELAARRLERIIDATGTAPETICVENLVGSPFGPIWEAVAHLGVSICFDAGHLLAEGGDPVVFMRRYEKNIRMAHVHGVADRDHRSLSVLPPETLVALFRALEELAPRGAVVIETYSLPEVVDSVRCITRGAERLFGERNRHA